MLKFFKRNRKDNIEHTQDAVKPTRDRWFGRILNVLRSSKLDDALWEELEEILISSDVGVETSLNIIEELKITVKKKRLDTGDDVFESLKTLERLLSFNPPKTDTLKVYCPSDNFPLVRIVCIIASERAGSKTSIN